MNKGKILIADDEESICLTLDTIFKEEGYITTTTKDGKRAQELIVKEKFDVVITDIKMPDIDGVELLKWIKKTYPQISVIMITGYASLNTSIESMRAGADDYIVKPFDVDYLKVQVQACINKETLSAEIKGGSNKDQLPNANWFENFLSLIGNSYEGLLNDIEGSYKSLLMGKEAIDERAIRSLMKKNLGTLSKLKSKFVALRKIKSPNFVEGIIIEAIQEARDKLAGDFRDKVKIDGRSLPDMKFDKELIALLFETIFYIALQTVDNKDIRFVITPECDGKEIKIKFSMTSQAKNSLLHSNPFVSTNHKISDFYIGLAIMYGVVECHSGKILVGDNEKNYMTILLPLDNKS